MMKLKATFLIAVGAVLSFCGVNRAFAATAFDTHLQTYVRVAKIEKHDDTHQTTAVPAQTLSAGATIYFDVTLADSSGNFLFASNAYLKEYTNAKDRPYLQLNVPLRGKSTKTKVAEFAADEQTEVTTATAVAYYIGQAPNSQGDTTKTVLRFAYDVRPGDMIAGVSWDRTAAGEPIFGGTIGAIQISGILSPTPSSQSASLTSSSLQAAAGANLEAEDTAQAWAVSGYEFAVGASYEGGALVQNDTDLNADQFYQGLVPVTISTRGNVAPTTFASTDAQRSNCYFWVEAKDDTDAWKYVDAPVTALSKASTVIKTAAYPNDWALTGFSTAKAAKFAGPTNADATTFTPMTFFVNLPASVGDGRELRLCYGARGDNYKAYATYTLPSIESPIVTVGASGYNVSCAEMDKKSFTLPAAADQFQAAFADLVGMTVSGGEIQVAAGDDPVTMIIEKTGLEGYGTVFACIERISTTGGSSVSFDRYYVPMNADAGERYTVNLSVKESDVTEESYFRIVVPQLSSNAAAVDKPFYLHLKATPKRSKIKLIAGAVTTGTEFAPKGTVTGADGLKDFYVKYTLTVEKTESMNRYFTVFPVAKDVDGNWVRIPEEAVFQDNPSGTGAASTKRKVYDVIKEYVRVASYTVADPTMAADVKTLSLPRDTASTDFYFACINDFPKSQFSSATIRASEAADAKTYTMEGLLFSAASCNANGGGINESDECEIMAMPDAANRTPVIDTATAESEAVANSPVNFSFTLADATADYLIVRMNYGDGKSETFLYANDAKMEGIMGTAKWKERRDELAKRYGFKANADGRYDAFDTGVDYGTDANGLGDKQYREDRASDGVEYIDLQHTYKDVSNAKWSLTVIDSSGASVTTEGNITFSSSQTFTFYTIKNATRPATGRIKWDEGVDWSFGDTFTYAAKPKSGNTTVTFTAKPFKAGEATPENYAEVSKTFDSFFYKWGARHSDYEALLPTTEEYLYEKTLSINRAFVSGGGQADDPTKWQDIILEAIFTAEYDAGDAGLGDELDATPPTPFLYALGDYNRDGVPDGWILRNVGSDAATRASLVETEASQANTMAVADYLPYASWAQGDAAYTFGNSAGRLGYGLAGGPTMQGEGCLPFGYKLRIRGRDDALNAADGSKWLSNPAWVVLVHPEVEAGIVRPGAIDQGVFKPEWTKLYLNTSGRRATDGKAVSHTAANRIPYDASQQVGDWAPVYDKAGDVVKTVAADGTVLKLVEVNVNAGSPDYETFRYQYKGWRINDTLQSTEDGALFPFATVAETDAAKAGNVAAYTGKTLEGTSTYCFVDARVPAGMLLDEPFYVDSKHVIADPAQATRGYLDPRQTSWLARFAKNDKDEDGDNISNAAEYYFWYYASRIAWGSAFKTPDGDYQLNVDLWPAVDLHARTADFTKDDRGVEKNHYGAWTDADFGTIERFTMGRRYNDNYNPDAEEHAYYEIDADGNVTTHADEADFGKGNYWMPIQAKDVLEAFDPYAAARANLDTDNDGLLNVEEFANGTNPIDCDTDNDWMPDGWEVQYGLNPLNLVVNSRTDSDAEKNPDNDYFARAVVKAYPEYHHFFKVNVKIAPEHDEDGNVVPGDPNAANDGSPFAAVTAAAYYFDYEAKAFRVVLDEIADSLYYQSEDFLNGDSISWDDGKDWVESWADTTPLFIEMKGKAKIIRDAEVYRTFGFHPGTAWGNTTNSVTSTIPIKVNDFGGAPNTQPFTNREEFNSSVGKEGRTDPTSADTNGDGCPDGWEAYVGLRPWIRNGRQDGAVDWDQDGLTTAQEFQCRMSHLVGNDYGWPSSLQSETRYDSTWVNKVLPTDPWNPDTDFDGIWDGSEGLATYTYSPSDGSWVGGGCNPTSMDTDGDGMPDGWEYRYGLIAGTDGTTTSTSTLASAKGPDPTDASDFDQDYDRDGLPQYQEYHTGFLRHLRYDLGPDAARIYKDQPGELTRDAATGRLSWTKLPDIYSFAEDLLNPQSAPSIDYAEVGMEVGTQVVYDPFTVSPFKVAYATVEKVRTRKESNSAKTVEETICMPAISAAFSQNFSKSIFFPTALQTASYGLLPEPPNGEVDFALLAVKNEVNKLQSDIQALDAAWQRLLSHAPDYKLNYSQTAGDDRTRDEMQLRALIKRIDAALESLATRDKVEPVLKELIDGEAKELWAKRKEQMLKTVYSAFYAALPAPNPADPAYAGLQDLTAGLPAAAQYTGTDPETDLFANVMDVESPAYEKALVAAKSPLLKQQYRSAIRGYTGGVTTYGGSYYLAPLGLHMPVLPFEDREAVENNTFFVGVPLEDENTIGAYMPSFSTTTDSFMTTSPLVADTDRDGMDDYWEVFHGLNPILGDFANEEDNNGDSSDRSNYTTDKIAFIYNLFDTVAPRVVNGNAVYAALAPTGPATNPFAAPLFELGRVTGFDYYTYPWLAGTPMSDPDGDGLLNAEEAVNPATSDPAHYGTDPSPLWMTDPNNRNSFVARFYTRRNLNVGRDTKVDGELSAYVDVTAEISPVASFSFAAQPGYDSPAFSGEASALLPYEVNEGYDTDGDGVSDLIELTSSTIYRGDPQTLRTPDRQQAAYFGGKGALQSFMTTQFGPMALTTFTIECWVKPDADAGVPTAEQVAAGITEPFDVILVDRPWRFNENPDSLGDLRHNFRLGLRPVEGGFKPFVLYTGSGTTFEDDAAAPKASPEVLCGETIKAEVWNHVAATYDGTRLAIILNGVENAAVNCSLIPANGVISSKNDGLDEVQRFTYRNAPIMVGAGPAETWFSSLGDPDDPRAFGDFYAGCYKGFIDEVRIWHGARTAAQIGAKRSSGFTQSELLTFRVNAFNARLNGEGYYEPKTPAYPVAIYTFNDLLGGTRVEEGAGDDAHLVPANEPWERYPSMKLVATEKPGSFDYRRMGFRTTREQGLDPAMAGTFEQRLAAALPDEKELFTSYYTLTAPKNLRSSKYYEDEDPAAGFRTEFVPLAHNTVGHLPLADVELDKVHLFHSDDTTDGSPEFLYPSGSVENLKAADSVYWSPYAAGKNVGTSAIYSVKTAGNPYSYRYLGVETFDVDLYTTRAAYTLTYPSDLLIYGDVFAKYDTESWDNSPSTDPSAGTEEGGGTGGGGNLPGDSSWFEYASGDKDMNDVQLSEGGKWLEDNIGQGQTKDSDGDRMYNWWENYYGLDPEDATGLNGPHGDGDGDGLTNYAEFLAKSDPNKYSTAGNGVPDFHIPVWFRRGRPTFGLLYTDNDFMEDHWEASNRNARLSVDIHDAYVDADGDGWSNWAEVRANFRTGNHSTNPNAETSTSQDGAVVLEMPTPALRLTIDYFGDQDVYTNAMATAQLVVHAYTAKNNNSAPDAIFNLPLSTSESTAAEGATYTQPLGYWRRGVFSGYLHMGTIMPGSLEIQYRRTIQNVTESTDNGSTTTEKFLYFTIVGDTVANSDVAELYTWVPSYYRDENGKLLARGQTRVKAGTINYRTGYYTLDFSNEEDWPDLRMDYDTDDQTGIISNLAYYQSTEFEGKASYKYKINPGQSNTFTLVRPTSGHLREGANNFFVFADLNGDGTWNNGEPAGVPDQHDVDVGFDLVNQPLHVALSVQAPPGAVRLDVKSILGVLITENNTNDVVTGDTSSITNPSTGRPLRPSDFNAQLNYNLYLVSYESIALGGAQVIESPGIAYWKEYNKKKPYLTEDEIFSASLSGLPGTAATQQIGSSYKVYLVPQDRKDGSVDQWVNYNVAVVTNIFSALDEASTSMASPIGGALRTNTELDFEWLSNVQVPSFQLTITKVEDATGKTVSQVVYDKQIRGVTPCGTALGTGSVEQFRYRYRLDHGIGELSADGKTVFGDGLYNYTLALKPYNGSGHSLKGSFRLMLTDSGDKDLREFVPGDGLSTRYNVQDSWYLRARVRYTGVLKDDADFYGRRLRIEAHYSGSFNGDPVASTSDILMYDKLSTDAAGTVLGYKDTTADGEEELTNCRNRCVRMLKDRELNNFFGTRFDAELRGLPTNQPVYVVAYFDLNGNGKRDTWEPWGYATQGIDAVGGYYFDPKPITPVNNGTDYQTEFYIQDVDTDNDKLADSWEWKSNGYPGADVAFEDWCGKFTGKMTEHQNKLDIFVTTANGRIALSAYGAQLLGLTAVGEPDEDGAVQVEGLPDDLTEAAELMDLIDMDDAIDLAGAYTSYGLTVNNITFSGEEVMLHWDVTAALQVDTAQRANLSQVFADSASTSAVYAVYGKASLGDSSWTRLGLQEVKSVVSPSLTLSVNDLWITGADGESKQATFFKVILSAGTAAKTLAE